MTPTDFQRVASLVAHVTGLTVEQLRGSGRVASIASARHLAFALCRRRGASTPDIGRFFHRDHTTVILGSRKAEEKRGQAVDLLDAQLKAEAGVPTPKQCPRNPPCQMCGGKLPVEAR